MSSLLLRPHTVLIAAVRDPEAPTSQSLTTLSRDPESRLIVVKIDSLSRQDPQFAMADLTSNHGILHLDVVIANAGVNTSMAPVLETMPEEMREILEVNTLAPLLLFQAAWPLLQKSKSPKLVVMSSDMASIGRMNPNPGLAYGVSKAALDYVVKKIRVEHESVTAVALHPGYDLLFRKSTAWFPLMQADGFKRTWETIPPSCGV